VEKDVIINLDNMAVQFTSEGKVSVIDAIRAAGGFEHSRIVWKNLKNEHPEVLDYCENYSFQGKNSVPAVNSEAWYKIYTALLTYLPDPYSP